MTMPSLSGGPDMPSRRRNEAPALSSLESERAVQQAGHEPLESDREYLDEGTTHFSGCAII